MGFPDRIERTVEIAHPPARVWAALTTAEGLGAWFGNAATIDLRPGGAAQLTWTDGQKASMRILSSSSAHSGGRCANRRRPATSCTRVRVKNP